MARRDALTTVTEDIERTLATRPTPKPERSKATYDLPKAIIEDVNEIAAAEEVARSDVVAWAIWELVQRHKAGEVDWTGHRERADRNPRATWKLVIPGNGGD